jgi:recombination DNA repair RAD52 pathway protein
VLTRENRGSFLAVYIAKVRITVQADGTPIVREGHGSGEGRGNSPGEVHDIALKAAETDATKRALATFGKPFGLELYRKDKNIALENLPVPKSRSEVRRSSRDLAHTRTTRRRSRGHRITTVDDIMVR